jgi:hypothetical protein
MLYSRRTKRYVRFNCIFILASGPVFGLEVRYHMQAGHCRPQVGLDTLCIVMPFLYRPLAWHQHMKARKGKRSGLARTQFIKIYTLSTIRLHHFFDNIESFRRQGDIHQPIRGAAQ